MAFKMSQEFLTDFLDITETKIPYVYIYICTLKILLSLSEFDGLWKHQNNPACTKTKSVSLQNVEVGHNVIWKKMCLAQSSPFSSSV